MMRTLVILICSIFGLLNGLTIGSAAQQKKTPSTTLGVKFVEDESHGEKARQAEQADSAEGKAEQVKETGDKGKSIISRGSDKKEKKESPESGKNLAEFRAYVDKSLMTIGDKVKYTMEIDADKSVKIEFPSYASNLGGFAVRDFGKDKPVKSGRNRVKVKQWYIMDTYTTGSYVIPPQFARVRTPQGKEYTLKSPEIFVEVKSVIGDDNKKEGLRDIKLPVYIPFSIPPLAIVIGIIAIAAIAVGWFLYRRRKLKEKEIPPIPAHEQALLELKKIESMDLIEKGQVKEYYYMVSDVLRRYLEGRFSLRAPEQTTQEFLDNVTKSDALEGRYINLLKEYLMHCDMVKYAKLEPDKNACSKLIDTTRRFVNETKPAEVAEGEPQEVTA